MKKKGLVAHPTSKPLHRLSKTKAIAGMIILILGVSMIPTSFLMDNIIEEEIEEAIADQITVPTEDDDDYEEWLSNANKDAVPFYSNFHMWNLTNPLEYLAGETPVYNEVGPYVFREYTTKYNVRFSDDEEKVSYNQYTTYEFDPVGSGTRTLQDRITNINPGYLGVLDMTKSEKNLIGLMAPTIFSTIKETFLQEFSEQMGDKKTWDDIWDEVDKEFRDGLAEKISAIAAVFVQVPEAEINQVVNEIVKRIKNNMPNALDVFLTEWSDGCFPEIANELFKGINIDVMLQLWVQIVVTVVVWVVSIILFIFFPIFGLIAMTVATVVTVLVWQSYTINCELEKKGIGDMIEEKAHEMVIDGLDFDTSFFEDIDENSLNPNYLSFEPDYGKSNDLYSGAHTPLWKSENLWSFNDNFSLVGENGSIWFEAAAGNEKVRKFLMNRFSLTDPEMNGICNWLDEASDSWLKNICGYSIQNMSSGLITTRTVEEWLFSAEDELIKNVDPELAKVNIFSNCHNEIEAEQAQVDHFRINTGKKDIEKVKDTIEFNGEEDITMWAESVPVSGTDGTQFAPGVSMDDKLEVFVPDLVRPVEFEFSKETEIHDISLYRYKFSDDLFEPDPYYYMDTKGLANMYSDYDIPVYLSKPHFLDADRSVLEAVNGMAPRGDKHDTYIDVEPITGISMKARARVQVNFKVSPTDAWYTEIGENYMPILWVERAAEITKEKAEEFKEKLYGALELRKNLIPALIGIGAVMGVAGVLFSTSQSEKRRKINAKHKKIKGEITKISKKSNPVCYQIRISNEESIWVPKHYVAGIRKQDIWIEKKCFKKQE